MFKFPRGKISNINIFISIHSAHSLRGGLEHEEGQEELYDKLKREVLENGFNGCTGFFPAIYQKDCAGGVGYRLEINPDQMLPIETW